MLKGTTEKKGEVFGKLPQGMAPLPPRDGFVTPSPAAPGAGPGAGPGGSSAQPLHCLHCLQPRAYVSLPLVYLPVPDTEPCRRKRSRGAALSDGSELSD